MRIFVSYRRDDAAGYARAVNDELARRFGAERVFIDADDIAAGLPFDAVIARAMAESRVLLVLIGKRWRGERPGGPPRLFDAGDFVHREVAAGLAAGLRVIPLLLDGATMPAEADLPEALRPLARRHALEIGNARFAADVARLVAALRDALGEPEPEPATTLASARPWLYRALAGAAVLVGVVGTALWWSGRPPGPVVVGSPPGAPAAPRPAVDGDWQAEVEYDWPNARHVERFRFGGDGGELHGSASFLGVPRGVLDGRVDADGLAFVTRTREVGAGGEAEAVHRYRGRVDGASIRFVMHTEGGSSAHVPVEFVARRSGTAASTGR